MRYIPLGNRLIVKQLPITKEELVINGIEVPETAVPFRRGLVVSVGEGEVVPINGALIPMSVKEGDIVVYLAEAGHVPIRIDNEDHKLFRENQIECILEE